MLSRIDLRAGLESAGALRDALPRAAVTAERADAAVARILSDVRERGIEAVLEYGERFDGVRPESVRVPPSLLTDALAALDPDVRAALTESMERARRCHLAQLPSGTETSLGAGGTVRQRWIPVRRVGLYVPGGLAVYPSSVVMNVVPAQVAGVGSIAVTSPPQPGNRGWPDPTVLAACALLGVDEVYAAGGAQAIALLGYGAPDLDGAAMEPVDMITGPGNVYVTAAKRALRGVVAIDSEAGPTEIAVLADESADARSRGSRPDLAGRARPEGRVGVDHHRRVARRRRRRPDAGTGRADPTLGAGAGRRCDRATVGDDPGERPWTMRIIVANAYAAEHLEIQTRDADSVAARIRNAGAIFVGPYSPVSLGDYCAGSNHVLPTARRGPVLVRTEHHDLPEVGAADRVRP